MEYIIHSDHSHIRQEFRNFVETVRLWAIEDKNVLMAVILGSQAHPESVIDKWSDIDLAIIVQDQSPFDSMGNWIYDLTDFCFVYEESAEIGTSLTWHVILKDSRMIDLSVFSVSDINKWLSAEESVKLQSQSFFKSNLLVLIDKANFLNQLMMDDDIEKMLTVNNHPPRSEEIHNTINRFWYHTLRSLKHLYRNDLWRAFMSCNFEIKNCLLEVIEWTTKAQCGWDYDTRYEGRMIGTWAGQDIVSKIPDLYSDYDQKQLTQSLLDNIELFEQLCIELLEMLEYPPYPNTISPIASDAKNQLNGLIS